MDENRASYEAEIEAPRRKRLQRLRKLQGFRAVPFRAILPSLITLLALFAGLTAIRFAIERDFESAVFAIIAAAFFDGVDGRLARALNSVSRFGAELDSLADFVDFGVAPALTLYLWGLQDIKSLGWFAALIFAAAAALRLARFNVISEDMTRPAWMAHFFVGMPAPAAACLALLPIYVSFSFAHPESGRFYVFCQIAYILILALLMVSPIPHFSGKKIGRIPREYVVPLLLCVAAVVILLATFPMEMLTILSFIYLAHIPFAIRSYGKFSARDPLAEKSKNNDPLAEKA